MNRRLAFIWLLAVMACLLASCKDDVATTGESVLGVEDRIVVLADTFSISSDIFSYDSIISQADSFLLGEIETVVSSLDEVEQNCCLYDEGMLTQRFVIRVNEFQFF